MALGKKKKDPTIEDIVDTMNEDQKKVLYFLMYAAYQDGKNGFNFKYGDRFAELGFKGYTEV